MNTLRLVSEFHAGSVGMAETWAEMLAPATLATVLELAAEAGKRFDDASRRLGVHGGDTGASGGSRAASSGPSTHEMADALAGFHFPDDVWARLIYDLVATAGRLERATGTDPARSRAILDRYVAALVPIYFGRVASFVRREPGHHDRRGRGAGRTPGPRVRAAQAVPRRALERAMNRTPLPVRILIPVANPGTAGELVRIGAALLEPRAGELRALGIVEVPEGMPLSRGRHPRPPCAPAAPAGPRLCARRRADPPARPDRPARGRGHHRGGRRGRGRPAHLRLGRPAHDPRERHTARRTRQRGRTGPNRARSCRPRSTRSCAPRRATSRWSSSAGQPRSGGSSSRSAAGRMPSSR